MRERIYKAIEIAEDGDKLSRYYDCFMMFCIVGSIIPLCFKQTIFLFVWIDRITVTVFILDYFLRWITADLKFNKSKKIYAFLVYPFTPFAILDLLSILPSLTLLNPGLKILKVFRLSKALKALKVLRYSKSFNLIISVIKKESKALTAVCFLAGGYIFLSALVMFQVEPESFETFFNAIYWAVVTLTTVGYGDIYPISDIGRIISMVSSFVGIAIVALPTGIITAGYMDGLKRNEDE